MIEAKSSSIVQVIPPKIEVRVMTSILILSSSNYVIWTMRMEVFSKANGLLTNQDQVVVENTRSRVKIKSNLTNFKNNSRIEGHNGN